MAVLRLGQSWDGEGKAPLCHCLPPRRAGVFLPSHYKIHGTHITEKSVRMCKMESSSVDSMSIMHTVYEACVYECEVPRAHMCACGARSAQKIIR